ncbi:MAG TPA: bpX6 domain-containing protein [Candidatus Limnocylindrales bacterium]|nr:bpX6 domain-containing protein [Candidatus Limnocylindrales bacterium]
MSRTVDAAGFLIDVDLIGPAEATRRIIEYWQDGAQLRVWPDGRWLLVLPSPVTIRLDRSPGLALPKVGLNPAQLPEVELPFDLGHLTRYPLQPLETVPPTDILATPAPVHAPDLRRVAEIGPPPRRRRVRSGSGSLGSVSGPALDKVWQTLLALAAIAALLLWWAGGTPNPSAICVPVMVGLIVGLIGALRSRGRGSVAAQGGSAAGGGLAARRRSGRLRGWLAARAFTSPFGYLLARRHLAYLQRVERAFQRRDWEQALREAVPLGGVGGILSITLPQAWLGRLSPSLTGRSTGRALGVTGVELIFTDVYRRAAAELEQAGQIEKAAYVLADLLDTPTDAVHLLERHKMYRLAAQLAEGRRLEPALAVRLWWQSGDRQRAVDLALLRGAFAAALDRLGDTSPQLSRQLRTAWIESRREAGDHLGALAAAWPDPRLRQAGVADIQQVMTLGGPAGAHALAYLLNLHSDNNSRNAARALMASRDPALRPAQDRFLTAFATLAASQPVHDRQIATAAVVAMTLSGYPASRRKSFDGLGKRADRVTVADLPKPSALPKTLAPNHTCVPLALGDLPVHDAAWIGGRLLLAHGGHGVRLVRPDGHQVARWDVPAHQLVVADSATRVMLIAVGQQIHEFHELDLARRRVRRYAALRVSAVASTYDGSILTVTDEDGIAFLATGEDKPRVIWRELDRYHRVVLLERAPSGISALVRVPNSGKHELWTWNAPAALLRQRPAVDLTAIRYATVLASGHVVTLADTNLNLLHNGQWRKRIAPAETTATLLASGDAYALVEPQTDHIRVTVRRGDNPQPLAHLHMPQPPAGLRASADRVVIWGQDARVVAIDLDQRLVDADFRTTI